jgi:thiosulfate dehydrogenase [quinone] large subunit
MSYQDANPVAADVDLDLARPLTTYWLAILRVVTGWWFLQSGLSKLVTDGLNYTYATMYLKGMEGTVLGPVPVWMGTNMAWFVEAMVPLGEAMIGLGLVFGVLVRMASFFGAMMMVMFWVGNAEFGHGIVNADLMGLLLFVTMAVFATGRYFGLDAIIEQTSFVERHPRLRYLLG